jgi:endo-1,4-beta-xylanase
MCKAFKRVRLNNPNAKLIYNDYNNESLLSWPWMSFKAMKVFEELKALKNRGCPIDAVGFQGHFDIGLYDWPLYFEGLRWNI